MFSSRLDAAVRRKETSRAGKAITPPGSRAERSCTQRAAACSLGTTRMRGLPVSRHNPASRCSRWLSSRPNTP